jgi:hypothetical protein
MVDLFSGLVGSTPASEKHFSHLALSLHFVHYVDTILEATKTQNLALSCS